MKSSLAKNEEELAARLSAYIKTQAKAAGITYAVLAERMKKHGHLDETDQSIKAKLKRGTFPATFLVAALAALGLNGFALKDL